MTIACDLLQQHIETLVADNARWQTLIADDVVWELPFAVALGHPSRLAGRDEVVRHANWFVGAVGNFRFFDLRLHASADPEAAGPEIERGGVLKNEGGVDRQGKAGLLSRANGQ